MNAKYVEVFPCCVIRRVVGTAADIISRMAAFTRPDIRDSAFEEVIERSATLE